MNTELQTAVTIKEGNTAKTPKEVIQIIKRTHKIMYVGLIGYLIWPLLLGYLYVIIRFLTFKKTAKNLHSKLVDVIVYDLTTAITGIALYLISFLIFLSETLVINVIGVVLYIAGFMFIFNRTLASGRILKEYIKNV